jgi:hypothetical protein
MAAPYNDLLSKLEAALASLVSALSLTGTRGTESVSLTVNTGLDDDAAALPRATCHADDTTEEAVQDTGNFRIRAFVHVHTHSGDESLAVHRTRVATIQDAIMQDDIAAQLSAAVADFYCFEARFVGPQADPDGDAFHTALELSVVCCASDL